MLTFLGIGAQKAGTTWLYTQLRGHPDIAFPLKKERHFWDRPHDAGDLTRYLQSFGSASRCEGEITPAYAILPVDTIRSIHAAVPDVRLIYILRNPIERAWSSALMAMERAEMRFEETGDEWFLNHFRSQGSLARGDYAQCLRNWLSVFPREQILILRYESIVDDPRKVIAQCCAHLAVSQPSEDMLDACDQAVFTGPGVPLPAHLRRELERIYAPRIRALEKLLGWDCRAWLKSQEPVTPAHKLRWRLRFGGDQKHRRDREELRQSGLFDEAFYLANNTDVGQIGIDPIEHYLRYGALEGRQPNSTFDSAWYLNAYPDVAQSGINPLLHYWRHGMAEGRETSACASGKMNQPPAPEAPAIPQRPYADFTEFYNQSIFLLGFDAPLVEADQRVIGHMHGITRYLAQQYDHETPEVSVVLLCTSKASTQRALTELQTQRVTPCEIFLVSNEEPAITRAWLNDEQRQRCSIFSGSPEELLRTLQGEYLACLRDVDSWTPQFLAIVGGELNARLAVNAAYCGLIVSPSADAKAIQSVRYAAFSRALLENKAYIPPSTSVVRRAALLDWQSPAAVGWDELHHQWLLHATRCKPAHAISCLLVGSPERPVAKSIGSTAAGIEIKAQLPEHEVPGLERMHGLKQLCASAQSTARPLAIIIPSFECLAYLRLCVDAVRAFTPQPFQLIVVDNGSSADVRVYLSAAAERGDITLIQNTENLGFSYAVNQGIQAAGAEADIVLLNNDAVVTPGWIDALRAVFAEVPDAGLAVSRQVLLAGTKTMLTHNPACDDSREMDVNLSMHHRNVIDPCIEGSSGLAELSFAPFFLVYIPRATLNEIGPLDHENAPHYRSDRLYCEAVRRVCKRKIVYTPHAKVYHFLQRATHELRSGDKQMFTDMFVKNDWRAVVGTATKQAALGFYPRRPLEQLSDVSRHVGKADELIPSGTYTRSSTLNIAGYDTKFAHALRSLAGTIAGTPPVLEYRLSDVILVDQGIVLTPDGFAVEESLAETKGIDNAWVRVTDDGVWLKQEPTPVDARGLLLKKRGQSNYGHWLTELLVRLYVSQKHNGETASVIVHRPQQSHQFLRDLYRDSIELCSSSPIGIFELSGDPVRCAELTMVTGVSSHPEPKHPAGFPSWDLFLKWQSENPTYKHPVLMEMAARMKRQVPAVAPGRKVFITRSDAAMGRKIINAQDVENFFRAEGFELVDPANHPLREQMAIFSGATHVFGTLCAGFTNTLFTPSESCIGSLAPVYMNGVFYLDLESVCGRQAFNMLYCDYAERPQAWSLQSNIVVSMPELIAWYQGAMAKG